MNTRILQSLGLLAFAVSLPFAPLNAASFVTIEEGKDGQYDVKFGDELFTTLHTKGQAKPILYPIIGPYGIRMTRDYPMKEGTPNEAKDHPHQQSLWFTHGDVNGVSFWHLGDDAGRIQTVKVEAVADQGDEAFIRFANQWVDAKGKIQCTDTQTITFHKPVKEGALEYSAIDYAVTIHASEGDVVFGDTKEGTMGIRTHAGLRISNGAKAVNSEGETGAKIWGKRAKWVDYVATIDGHPVGVAIFDHPANPRHPTWWHARDYGLVAANPFGIHDFEKKEKGAGNLTLPKGKRITFRYRFVFHSGTTEAANIAKRFTEFGGQ